MYAVRLLSLGRVYALPAFILPCCFTPFRDTQAMCCEVIPFFFWSRSVLWCFLRLDRCFYLAYFLLYSRDKAWN